MIKELLYILIIIAGFPAGLLLKKLCKDEIKDWEKRFFIMSIIALIFIIILLFLNFQYKIPVIVALGFIIVTGITISLKYKSINNKI